MLQKYRIIKAGSAVLLLMLIISCAAGNHYSQALIAIEAGNWDAALADLALADAANPDSVEIEIAMNQARSGLCAQHSQQGTKAMQAGEYALAETHYKTALESDLSNALARDGLRLLSEMKNSERLFQEGLLSEESEQTADAIRLYQAAIHEYPGHGSARKHLIALEKQPPEDTAFPGDALSERVTFSFNDIALQDVFRSLAAVSGINILLDDGPVFQKRVSLELEDVAIGEALTDLGRTYGLLVVDLNPGTFLIALDTPENRTRNTREEVRLFRLKYADASAIKKMIAPVLKSSVILADERINAVVVRTDSRHMSLVRELISSLDIRESEVLIEMEVLEISRDKVAKLGTSFGPDPHAGLSIGGKLKSAEGSGRLSLSDLNSLSSGQIFITLPSLYLDLLKQDSQTRILAQPRLQILNRTPAKLHIGEKVPVKVTTSLFRDTAEETSVYEYRDVGILMNLTPRILNPNELALDLHLEISSIVSENASGHPTIGTRDVMTTLRLRNGETEIIAGLIKDYERTGTTRIPILGDIPIMGKLFSSNSEGRVQTDIVISLTPHILDRRIYPRSDTALWSGLTEPEGRSGAVRPTSVELVPHTTGRQGIIPGDSGDDLAAEPAAGTRDPAAETSEDPDTLPDTRVFIDPNPLTVKTGNTGIVNIRIADARNVGSVPFYIEFNPEIIQIGRVTEGGFLSRDGQSTAFMSSVDNERGRLIVGATRLGGGTGISGDGILLDIEITGKQAGESPLRFTHQSVRDPVAAVLPAQFEDGKTEVTDR